MNTSHSVLIISGGQVSARRGRSAAAPGSVRENSQVEMISSNILPVGSCFEAVFVFECENIFELILK